MRDGKVVRLFASFDVECGAFTQTDPLAQRSGWLELPNGTGIDIHQSFVAFARGESTDGGLDPIWHGNPLLSEWVSGRLDTDHVGERVVAQQTGPQSVSALNPLDRIDDPYVLRSTDPDSPGIDADGSVRLVARLSRPLD